MTKVQSLEWQAEYITQLERTTGRKGHRFTGPANSPGRFKLITLGLDNLEHHCTVTRKETLARIENLKSRPDYNSQAQAAQQQEEALLERIWLAESQLQSKHGLERNVHYAIMVNHLDVSLLCAYNQEDTFYQLFRELDIELTRVLSF